MSDKFILITCCTCGTVHWIPPALWETMRMTRNDPTPRHAYCPYGHGYRASGDSQSGQAPKEIKGDNVIKLEIKK